MRILFLFFISFAFCIGCSSSKRCAKELVRNKKFTLLKDGKLTDNYFVIKDSIHYEYSNTKLYGVSLIKWSSCNEYKMIVKEIYYKEPGLAIGDTLSMKIQSVKGDTLNCIATAFNISVPMTYVKAH